MIFNSGPCVLESEKERNLYTKFFAGYFFNEFIDGYDERVVWINSYLSKKLNKTVSLQSPSIIFDNHTYLLDIDSDRGEFADILLHDPVSKTMIAIEAKYLTNWSIEKDIKSNLKRINAIRERYYKYTIHFCLLVSSTKWKSAIKMKKHESSSYACFIKDFKDDVGVLFWEDLVEYCDSKTVKKYMEYRLSLVNAPASQRYANIQN